MGRTSSSCLSPAPRVGPRRPPAVGDLGLRETSGCRRPPAAGGPRPERPPAAGDTGLRESPGLGDHSSWVHSGWGAGNQLLIDPGQCPEVMQSSGPRGHTGPARSVSEGPEPQHPCSWPQPRPQSALGAGPEASGTIMPLLPLGAPARAPLFPGPSTRVSQFPALPPGVPTSGPPSSVAASRSPAGQATWLDQCQWVPLMREPQLS